MNHPNSNLTPAPKKRRWLLVAAFLLAVALLVSIYYLRPSAPLITPLGQSPPLISAPLNLQKIVVGFIPYWLVADATPRKGLTHLAYFGIEFDAEGNLLTRYPDGAPELGFTRLKSDQTTTLLKAQKNLGSRILLTLKVLDKDAIASLVSSQTYRNNAINHTLEMVSRYDFDGIVIDLEYAGTPTAELKQNFTTFVSQLTTTLRREYPQSHTAIAVFADTASEDRIWQLENINRFVDHLIVMTYDFHRPSSPQAGPVAPLYGGCDSQKLLTCTTCLPRCDPDREACEQVESALQGPTCSTCSTCKFDYDISQAVRDISVPIPPSKILLGIPFYGYEWRVTAAHPFAHTYPKSGALASIGRVTTLLADPPANIKNLEKGWDDTALSPYLIFEDNHQTQVIWYENEASLGYKLDLVNTAGLGGIAIWALGYEGQNQEVWPLITQKFTLPL